MRLKPERLVHLIQLLATLIIIGCASKGDLPDHRIEDGVKGIVKSVKVETWIVQDKPLGALEVKFGFIPERLEIGQTPVLKRYDRYGRRLEAIFYDQDNDPNNRLVLNYNKNGHQIESIGYTNDGTVDYYETRTVNADGKVVEVDIDDRYKGRQYFLTYKYDSSGNQIEEIYYNEEMLPLSKTEMLYDNKGNLKEKRHYDSYTDGQWMENPSVVTYHYDSTDRLIVVKDYDTSSSVYLSMYEYDSSGNRIKSETYDHSGLRIRTKLKAYNTHGDVIISKEHSQYFEHPIYRYQYEYDDRDNWVDCWISVDDLMKYRVTRKIEYYE